MLGQAKRSRALIIELPQVKDTASAQWQICSKFLEGEDTSISVGKIQFSSWIHTSADVRHDISQDVTSWLSSRRVHFNVAG